MTQPTPCKPTLEDFVRQHATGILTAITDELLGRHRAEYQSVWGDEPLQGAGTPSGFFEIERAFGDLASWRAWLDSNRWCLRREYIDAAVASIVRAGFEAPWQGTASSAEITVDPANLRESLVFRGLNSRCRAVVGLIAKAGLPADAAVYAPESVTPLAKLLKSRYPRFVGSEYLPTIAEKLRFPGTRHEDVQALSFDSGVLDLYVSCEVMEHIPLLGEALKEAARVLRPDGTFLATFPFRIVDEDTQIKARIEDGVVRHLMEPEYHGNPVDPRGSLVFQIPGWDILSLARQSGFSSAEMVMVSSRQTGVIAELPIAVFRATR